MMTLEAIYRILLVPLIRLLIRVIEGDPLASASDLGCGVSPARGAHSTAPGRHRRPGDRYGSLQTLLGECGHSDPKAAA